jgi:hypothetical protein
MPSADARQDDRMLLSGGCTTIGRSIGGFILSLTHAGKGG